MCTRYRRRAQTQNILYFGDAWSVLTTRPRPTSRDDGATAMVSNNDTNIRIFLEPDDEDCFFGQPQPFGARSPWLGLTRRAFHISRSRWDNTALSAS